MEIVAWIAVVLVFSLMGEVLAAITIGLDADEKAKPAAFVWFALMGAIGGVVSAFAIPERLLAPGPIQGMSVVVLPVTMGSMLGFTGWARGVERSHLVSWYGGAAIGFGLAVGRLAGIAFMADVQAL